MRPLEAKVRGGRTAGRQALDDGRSPAASAKGAERAREIAREFREAADE